MISKQNVILMSKGFAMGMADIVPGVSGGTIALIAGIYDTLIETVSSVNKEFFKKLLRFDIKAMLEHINGPFILPLFAGIISAIVLMSRVMHFFMNHYGVYTWSLFFGLILASIYFISKMIPDLRHPKNLGALLAGTLIGYSVVSLIPVQTPDTLPMIFLSGCIAICAMILPGISGSFILLILGKYLTVTSALKSPALEGNIAIILVFCVGCGVGLLSFSKLLNYLLKNFHHTTMAVLTGFMVGSLKKIWPWKEVLETKIVRGKTHVLRDANIVPSELNTEVFLAIFFMIFGFLVIFALEKWGKKFEQA